MKSRRLYLFAVTLTLGLLLAGRGIWLWSEVYTGDVIRNWIAPSTVIPENAGKWAWGVGGDSGEEPDQWHFQVFFEANHTANVLLMWNLNQSVLFARNSSKIDESFAVALPVSREAWRWDWLIRNPNSTILNVYNFTVTHYSISFPERQNGFIAIAAGSITSVVAGIAIVYLNHRDSQRK
jgi:hypothetical protein